MSRLWILISHLSKVFVPWPAGDFRVGTISFLVGRGIGPFSLTPVLSAISLISAHIVLISWGAVLDRRILALETIPRYLHDSTFLAEFTARPRTVKNVGISLRTSIGSFSAQNTGWCLGQGHPHARIYVGDSSHLSQRSI